MSCGMQDGEYPYKSTKFERARPRFWWWSNTELQGTKGTGALAACGSTFMLILKAMLQTYLQATAAALAGIPRRGDDRG